jgi:hypothetical protein
MMIKSYRSPEEIADVFWITLPIVRKIIKKHKVDTFTSKGIKVHIKDFYTAYTRYYNPSLFQTHKIVDKKNSKDISDIFQQLFGKAYTINQ